MEHASGGRVMMGGKEVVEPWVLRVALAGAGGGRRAARGGGRVMMGGNEVVEPSVLRVALAGAGGRIRAARRRVVMERASGRAG
jgi:hypothetical protein